MAVLIIDASSLLGIGISSCLVFFVLGLYPRQAFKHIVGLQITVIELFFFYPCRKYKCIGRRLAVMTDDYFQRVRPQIYEAVDLCDISVDTNGREAYIRFIAVANGLVT